MEVVDQLCIVAVLVCQDVLEFEGWSDNLVSAVEFEDSLNLVRCIFATDDVSARPVGCALRCLELHVRWSRRRLPSRPCDVLVASDIPNSMLILSSHHPSGSAWTLSNKLHAAGIRANIQVATLIRYGDLHESLEAVKAEHALIWGSQ